MMHLNNSSQDCSLKGDLEPWTHPIDVTSLIGTPFNPFTMLGPLWLWKSRKSKVWWLFMIMFSIHHTSQSGTSWLPYEHLKASSVMLPPPTLPPFHSSTLPFHFNLQIQELLPSHTTHLTRAWWEWRSQECIAFKGISSWSFIGKQEWPLQLHLVVSKEEHHLGVSLHHAFSGKYFTSWRIGWSKLWFGKGPVHSIAMIFAAILSTLMMAFQMNICHLVFVDHDF